MGRVETGKKRLNNDDRETNIKFEKSQRITILEISEPDFNSRKGHSETHRHVTTSSLFRAEASGARIFVLKAIYNFKHLRETKRL